MAGRVVTRGGLVRGRLAPRRSTQWLASADELGTTTLPFGSAILDQSFVFGEPATIIRTRGTLWIATDQFAATEQPLGAMGMAVVTDQAAGIGVTAVPTPITDSPSDEFFLWLPWFADVRDMGTGTVQFNTFSRFDFDSKAMRKVTDGTTAVVVLENSSSAAGANYAIMFRMLVKLHG